MYKELDLQLRCACETYSQLQRDRLWARMESLHGNWLYALRAAKTLTPTARLEAQKTIDYWKREYDLAYEEYGAWSRGLECESA